MRRLAFLGPPGAGKGTQAASVSRALGIAHLSTGDLLRAAVAAGTPLGREAEGHMKAGALVPDALVLRILAQRIAEPDAAAGFLLDGFPRNRAQAEALASTTPLDRVVSFDIPTDLLTRRITDRRSCPTCHTVYNLSTRPPRVPGKCDREGSELIHRPDDRAEVVATRLAVYDRETKPLLEYYLSLGILRRIDADGPPDIVERRVMAALDP